MLYCSHPHIKSQFPLKRRDSALHGGSHSKQTGQGLPFPPVPVKNLHALVMELWNTTHNLRTAICYTECQEAN